MSTAEKVIRRISLHDIRTSHNPRRPAPQLQDNLEVEGLGGYSITQLIQELALSDDPKVKARFVKLIEKYESYPRGIVELAQSRRKDELQSVKLRSYRVKNINAAENDPAYVERYGIIAGERRTIAAAYNHAKHGDPAEVGATTEKMTLIQAEDAAFDENMQRKDMTELEVGLALRRRYERQKQKQKNDGVARRLTFMQFCKNVGLDYQYGRSREALTHLPENLQGRVDRGTLGVTEAAKIGHEIKTGKRDKEGNPREGLAAEIKGKAQNRSRVMTLKELHTLFDKKRNENEEYLRGLAAAMRLTLKQAVKQSDKRIKEEEEKLAAKQERELRRAA